MKEWPAGSRVAILATSAAALLAALAHVGAHDDPYAANEWLFSHVLLAEAAIENGRVPFNRALFVENGFRETAATFREETGMPHMTFYANTAWHFWNGLPLQPAFLASWAALSGHPPEEAAREPLGALAVALLAYAAADLALARSTRATAAFAPFGLVLGCAPFLLDLRILMPSVTLVIVAATIHLLLRRHLVDDGRATAYAIAPLALLPFWYYTVSYFVLAVLAGFLVARLALGVLRVDHPPIVPLWFALAAPALVGGGLVLTGALTSQMEMASHMGSLEAMGGEATGDYGERLNRTPWRSGLLYAGLALFFAPLAVLALRALVCVLATRAPPAPVPSSLAHWCVGGAAFSLALPALLGPSFLNRGVIYLAPLAAVALAVGAARSRALRATALAAILVGAAVTPAMLATAAPQYGPADVAAFAWVEAHVPREDRVYASLDVASVLLRTHGFHGAIAFHPRTELLDRMWYGEDPDAMVPYLASVEWFVVRDDAREVGFNEFGPLRAPIGDAAYAKFEASRDLHRVFDNGAVQVYRVALEPHRLHDP